MLESRNVSGYYAADREAAVKQALELIPEGSSIAMGGCTSAHEIWTDQGIGGWKL
ncbi:MAG: LUD domain-containing protein [Ruminococcus sp.]